jgi:hypothetical protein
VAPQPGPILEIDTDVELGQHTGLWSYTIGQGAKLPGLSQKLFVARKDHQKNAIYVALPESVVGGPPLLPFPCFLLSFISVPPVLTYVAATQHCSPRPLLRTTSPGYGTMRLRPPHFHTRASGRAHRSAIA